MTSPLNEDRESQETLFHTSVGKYALFKTLRFELRPLGRTLEHLKNTVYRDGRKNYDPELKKRKSKYSPEHIPREFISVSMQEKTRQQELIPIPRRKRRTRVFEISFRGMFLVRTYPCIMLTIHTYVHTPKSAHSLFFSSPCYPPYEHMAFVA